jgi:hypothetical protein
MSCLPILPPPPSFFFNSSLSLHPCLLHWMHKAMPCRSTETWFPIFDILDLRETFAPSHGARPFFCLSVRLTTARASDHPQIDSFRWISGAQRAGGAAFVGLSWRFRRGRETENGRDRARQLEGPELRARRARAVVVAARALWRWVEQLGAFARSLPSSLCRLCRFCV